MSHRPRCAACRAVLKSASLLLAQERFKCPSCKRLLCFECVDKPFDLEHGTCLSVRAVERDFRLTAPATLKSQDVSRGGVH